MQSTIARVGGFEYVARIEPIGAPTEMFSLSILSTWSLAKVLGAEQRALQLNLDADGLRAMRRLIDGALRSVGDE
jgi:hypothetical protein